jgi:hypothetical protein
MDFDTSIATTIELTSCLKLWSLSFATGLARAIVIKIKAIKNNMFLEVLPICLFATDSLAIVSFEKYF